MCTPARAALLTGKNPHAVGCGWLTFNDPGYPGYRAGEITRDAPTLAELLRGQGYATYCVGKWHNTAEHNVTPSADRASWPLARGFDRFYGFVGGETHYFAPAQLVEDNAFCEHDVYHEGYYCTDDWTDKAIAWLKAHDSTSPGKPLFLYVAHNAPHAPLHAKPRTSRGSRACTTPGGTRSARRGCASRSSRGCSPSPRACRRAAPASRRGTRSTRSGAGCSRATWSSTRRSSRTPTGTSGGCWTRSPRSAGSTTRSSCSRPTTARTASGASTAPRTTCRSALCSAEDPAWVRDMLERGRLGAADSWPAYPLGWTDVSSVPFRLYKSTTMNGGIRVPLVVHWPKGVADAGAVRRQWVHVTDIVPTAARRARRSVSRAARGATHARGRRPSFRPALTDASAPPARAAQHYELAGNRGYISGRWKIVSLQPPGKAIDLANWMLFDLDADPAEIDDVAAAHPDVLADLVAAFEADAEANYVYPLDNRDVRRSLTVPPYLEAALAQPRAFHPDAGTAPLATVAPMVADRDYRIVCDFAWSPQANGVVFALGDPIAGMALYARDGRLRFVYHGGQGKGSACNDLGAASGNVRFELAHRALGDRKGVGTLRVNGRDVATLDMSPTTILGLGVGEGLDVGCDRRLHVAAYGLPAPCRYTAESAGSRSSPARRRRTATRTGRNGSRSATDGYPGPSRNECDRRKELEVCNHGLQQVHDSLRKASTGLLLSGGLGRRLQ